MMGNLKFIIIIAVLGVALIASNVVQFFLNKNNLTGIMEEYTINMQAAQDKLDSLGAIVPVYRIINPEGVKARSKVKSSDIETKYLHSSVVPDNAITSISDLNYSYYRLDLSYGATLTKDFIVYEPFNNSTRIEVLKLDAYPPGMAIGDYIDIVIKYPMGEEFVVFSKLRVKDILGENIIGWLTRTEQYLLAGVQVDRGISGSMGTRVFARRYVDSGSQTTAVRYYVPPENIIAMMIIDPNMDSVIDPSSMRAARRVQDNLIALDEELAALISGLGDSIIDSINDASTAYTDKYGSVVGNGEIGDSLTTNTDENTGLVNPSEDVDNGMGMLNDPNDSIVIGGSSSDNIPDLEEEYDDTEEIAPDETETGGEPVE